MTTAPGAEPAGGAPDPARDSGQVGPQVRRDDPERGLRGVMSATLILEAVVVLLSIPVATNTGSGTGPVGVLLICALAAVLIASCAFVSKAWFVPVALSLQGLMIIGWLITASLGVMGIVFGLVWCCIIAFRNEFRRRLAAGTLPGRGPSAGGPA